MFSKKSDSFLIENDYIPSNHEEINFYIEGKTFFFKNKNDSKDEGYLSIQKFFEIQKLNINYINQKNETCFNISLTSSHTNIYIMLLNYIKNIQKEKINKEVKEFIQNILKKEDKIIPKFKRLFNNIKKYNSLEIPFT